MRLLAPSLLGLYGLLSASVPTVAQPSGDTDFMSVRENLAKDYESEGEIPTDKYFSKPHYFGLIRVSLPKPWQRGPGPSSISLLTTRPNFSGILVC
jgi:hypothetical protein